MADYQRKIMVELEQIEQAIAKLPSCFLSELNYLELSGVGGILQSFYNGIENILKQIFLAHGKDIPGGDQWHREILQRAFEYRFISEKTLKQLIPYLTFRHLYRNAYVLELKADRMQILVDEIESTFSEFKKEIGGHCD
jgi:hypothetical protein